MNRVVSTVLKITAGLVIGFFLLVLVVGIMLPDAEPTDSNTASQTLTEDTAQALTGVPDQDKEWINNTQNNINVVQQTDTAYKNECERDGATYQSKYNAAVEVENIAMQAVGISQQATVSPDLQEVKANYENYLIHLRLYAAWKEKAWASMASEGVNTQAMDYGESGQIEEGTANEYLEKYNSGMSDYLKSHRA
ncbi:hypothetical protein [Methanosarcina mazei]|jgi:hypothetical protein|uniref:Uncharacterized protein n=1 Tax=Methanosarcina mazei TaxID=2209 RepID=A0A0F8GS93_METMZ|nr:hypothetical protein [Methanosarcina mazei]KKG33784.1 hypothetical protein DU49_09360 [Methanosarcina mazei]KKG39276.1 hypothetical protein DU41_12095 [Methanosarcina mazei]KKG41953.1 hypothetical protein DU39_09780 [Methanosarcina mazei]KKG46144.1 hypothetical protein DU35_04210 [Methanosarcina mazei]KKG53656.1 hypothetical protein DU38_11465 [Methanosarcina mazei]